MHADDELPDEEGTETACPNDLEHNLWKPTTNSPTKRGLKPRSR
jgi:hypothetical protein